jgi:hypothetical protein
LIIGLAVFSHWILDLVAARSRSTTTWQVGFGLWNYRDPELRWKLRCLLAGSVYLARNAMSAIRKAL